MNNEKSSDDLFKKFRTNITEMEKRKNTVEDVTYSPKFSHFEIRGEGGLEGENNHTTFPQMLLLIEIVKVFTCLFSSLISPQVRVWSHFLSRA